MKTALIFFFLLTIFVPVIGYSQEIDEPGGHNSVISEQIPAEISTTTDQPGVPDVPISEPVNSERIVSRDEGEGNEEWSITDERAISSKVAMSADGSLVAIGYTLNDQRLEVRNGQDSELLFDFPIDNGSSCVAMTADGEQIAYAGLDSVWIFSDDGEGVPFFRFGMDGYSSGVLDISRDGEYLVATGMDPDREENRVWCFLDADPEPIWTLEVSYDEAFGWYGVSISYDASVVVINGKYRLYVLNLETGETIWEAPTYNTERPIAISEDASVLAIGSFTGVLLAYIRDQEQGGYRELWRYRFRNELSSWVSACQLSRDGMTLAAGTLDFFEDHYEGRLALFDTFGNGEPLWIAEPLGDEVSDIAFSDDGWIVAATSWGDFDHQTPDLVIHERHNPEPFYMLSTPGSMRSTAISDRGDYVIVGGKGTHSRVFGSGGIVSMVSVSDPRGRITGRVTDEDDDPLEDAIVSTLDSPYSATTNEDGRYELSVEADNVFDLRVCKYGYENALREDVRVSENGLVEDVDFSLREVGLPPENVRASQGRRNRITLNWNRYGEDGRLARDEVTKQSLSLPPERLLRYFVPRKTELGKSGDSIPILSCVLEKVQTNNKIGILSPDLPSRSDTLVSCTMSLKYESSSDKSVASTIVERDNADDIEGFNIYRSFLSGGPYSLTGSVDAGDTLFYDADGLIPGQRYYYVVTADFGNGESDLSEEAAGWLDDEFLLWEAELEPMQEPPEIDGTIHEGEWEGAIVRDISDIYGFDDPDSAGSVEVRIGFDDDNDRLLFGFSYYVWEELSDRMGVGIYIDDDGDGQWTRARPGSEGNHWGYWIDGAPDLKYRSMCGPPYNSDPYYQFEDPELAFSDERGYVEIEVALPLGFHDPYEIGLYHPDYTIGLGLFAMYRDEEDNAIFNAWWPQDMFSIVSFPEQFARITIPADLIVPPVAPEDVELEREEDNLILTWSDPRLGIDDGDVVGLAGINVYRNSELVNTVDPGSERFIDDDVIREGWYKYSLAGFVMEDDEPFEGVVTRPIGIYAGIDPEVVEINYDDGSAEMHYVVAFDGEDNRFAVRFDLDEVDDTVYVYWIDFYVGSISPISAYVTMDEEGVPGGIIGESYLVEPYNQNEFNRFHFPGVEQPIVISDPDEFHNCWVVLNYLPDSPGNPSIGVDTSQPDVDRNMYYRESTGWLPFDRGQIMIRAAFGSSDSGASNEDDADIPTTFQVYQNYPNPFNNVSFIPVDISDRSRLSVKVFDVRGRLALMQDFGIRNPGSSIVSLNCESLGTGVYFVKVTSGNARGVLKVLLVK